MEDPFVTTSGQTPAPRESHRYSSFDTQLFNLNSSSPAQAKRALEAHLAETERRLEEASKLGTALIEQQQALTDRLKEVEQQQDEGEMGPELRQRLADLEQEYNEIGRETARAFLGPKRMAAGLEDTQSGTPGFDQKSPLSSALFASQSTNSPSKVSVPSRKQRNQPSSRVHDIEFATEISTSLLAQVRQLQAMLAEREETLKAVNLEKSRLEIEAEGYSQRIRALDDSEQRYKDENWALETQTHELMAAVRDATEREKRLNASLSSANAEKNAVEREVEELRQTNAKLAEEQAIAQKMNDSEIHLLRRNLTAGDAEKLALQKKLEELTGQNQELAKAVAMRIRQYESQDARALPDELNDDDDDQVTPESSPPQSPNKFTPRHGHLETETLKSSLGHAHRMIQNLKSTIHREKTEKIELKRMLQEARDEVEQRRRETNASNASVRRLKTKEASVRKPARPDLLGAGRKERASVELEFHDTDWEDNAGQGSPTRPAAPARDARTRSMVDSSTDEPSDVYQTATEAEEGFETANERATATESDAFQTGLESMAGDSSDDSADLTETETSLQRTPRTRQPSLLMSKTRDRDPYHSTASATSDEEDTDGGFPSPGQQTHFSGRRVRTKRSVLRRIRPSGEAPMAINSRPSSARASPAPSFEEQPAPLGGQSLFAELAELEGGDEDDDGDTVAASPLSTPRMSPSNASRRPSEVMLDTMSKPVMVDSGVMTDPWEPSTSITGMIGAAAAGATAAGATGAVLSTLHDRPTTPRTNLGRDVTPNDEELPGMTNSSTQWTPLKHVNVDQDQMASVPTPPKMAWDDRSVKVELVEAGTQAEPVEMSVASISSQETLPLPPRLPELTTSYFSCGFTVPEEHTIPVLELPKMVCSSIESQSTAPIQAVVPPLEPVIPVEPVRELPELSLSPHFVHFTKPIQAHLAEPEPQPIPVVEEVELPQMEVSNVASQHIEPVMAVPAPAPEPIVLPAPVPVPILPDLAISELAVATTVPVKPMPAAASEPIVPNLSLSLLEPSSTEPVQARVAPPPEPIVIQAPVPEPVLPDLTIALTEPTFTEPIAPAVAGLPDHSVHAISDLSFIETKPSEALAKPVISMNHIAMQTDFTDMRKATVMTATAMENGGVSPDMEQHAAIDHTAERRVSAGLALSDVAGNALLPESDRQQPSFVSSDHGCQTILSSKQIDQILMDRDSSRPISSASSGKHAAEMAAIGAAAVSPFATPKLRPRLSTRSATSSQRRPDTATSQNSSLSVHPPLPADHREAIAAAEKKSIDLPHAPLPANMGPPAAPASAYRVNVQAAPRTPNEPSTGPGSARTLSTQARVRRGSQSQMSRRSSVSSFASEIDERFNTSYAGPMPNGYNANTDPRMIQAITQTMIGEFLWKYTRKTGSSDMSSTRHRRYFWVHPYTRTLYWSEQDPQTAGKAQLRTKSVPIEAVRVVADDNPYPPGLHCRSLEVVSPGRRVRFTATTSQRHETWYNALSYLLLRDGSEKSEDNGSVTLDDIDEFNPGFRSSSRLTTRMSVSSYNSRTLRQRPQRATSAMSMRSGAGTPGRASPALSTSGPSGSLQVPDDSHQRSSSRLSSILNSSIRGSFTSLKTRNGQPASLPDESIRDKPSMETLSHEADDEDRLENVRACCDGKHDVGSLSRNSKFSPRVNRMHSHH
ncbi:Uncharacterized protein PECH_003831 [Penicillium ucsense]|uniref:PH domain-containing protein n=1 Tax=Penicillium ucsense TaxID=2839758 RepID=A0A8J8W0H3_9EURO|nr:Uncharacterized protein PECM_001712 [Penicillium ucsense]KAF7737381.1 Uncharacterized protein PECH_003831 [Penicillium ucsense]